MSIDWKFIGELEGYHLKGYVPDASGSQSGVTVATGVDLGQMPAADLDLMPPDLAKRLRRYVGLRGTYAREELDVHPLIVTDAEAAILNDLAQRRTLAPLRFAFEREAKARFDDQPSAFQTVVASVTYQYGSPWKRTPNFWARVVARDIPGMIACLSHFGDRYPTRRRKEADYLKSALMRA